MRAFSRLGLPAVTAIGYGERRRAGRLSEAWFLGNLVPDAQTLGQAQLAAAASHDNVRVLALARQALDVTAQLHRHPWLHRDLHSHNLLLTREGALLITDLHSVWHVPRLTHAMRCANLARLLYSMRGVLNLDNEFPGLLASYAGTMGLRVDSVVTDVTRAISAFGADYVRGRTARCLQKSSLFGVERLHLGRLYHRRTYSTDCVDGDLKRHDEAARTQSNLLGHSARSLVTRVGGASAAGGTRVVKEFLGEGLLPTLRQRCGFSRARGAWVGARVLDLYGIPTPEALALLERSGGRAVLITRELPNASSLRDRALQLASLRKVTCGEQTSERAALARAVGFLVGCLARAGLRHADLSAKNLLVTAGVPHPAPDIRIRPPTAPLHVSLIDLDGLKRMPAHDPRGLARMLGQLGDLPPGVTRTDLLRFRRAYAAAAGRDIPRAVLQEAARRTRERVQRRERLARPVKDAHVSI